jgi:hypothetical protein
MDDVAAPVDKAPDMLSLVLHYVLYQLRAVLTS